MNTIKTLSALLFLSACTAACADGSKTSTEHRSSTETDTATATSKNLPGRTPSKAPVTPDEVISFRGGESPTDTSDYGATDSAFRVYGIEAGDGTLAASATIAEVGVWTTRTFKVGDNIGRGLVVSKIDDSGVTLHGAHADVTMTVGVDTILRVIRHDHDVVAQPLGRHRFILSTVAAKAALETVPARPAAEAVTLYEKPMLKLGDVAPNGLWASADFRKGDLIALVDGKPADDHTLDALETALTDGRAKVSVTIYRGGVDLNRSYEADPAR